MAQRHFKHPHPTFGRRGATQKSKTAESSIYYWWWQCLRRNDGYLRTCANGGTGRMASLYSDFGDVRGDDFSAWWGNNRGAELFAEPTTPNFITELRDPSEWSSEWTTETVMVLAIPLNFPKRNLKKKLNQLLKKRHKGKRGRPYNALSQAKYQVKGNFNLATIKKALDVYDCWYEAKKQKMRKPLWQVGLELDVNPSAASNLRRQLDDTSYGKRGLGLNEKSLLASTTSRYLKNAKRMIDATARGRFPR